jgi:hypothetical protein
MGDFIAVAISEKKRASLNGYDYLIDLSFFLRHFEL